MPDIGPILFGGGLVPVVIAALTYAAVRRISPGPTWSAGVIAGFIAGAWALAVESWDSVAVAAAARRLIRPLDSPGWLPLLSVIAAAPASLAALTRRRWVELVLAGALCVGAPAWLLWSKYRASQQLREAGFADDAITPAGAVGVLVAIAVMTLAVWALWRKIADRDAALPRTRSALAIVVTVGAAMAAALTGALVIGQLFGALAAAIGGCAVASMLLGDATGPESARGPVVILFAGLLVVAVVYSETHAWHAMALAAALVIAGGWLPVEHGWPHTRRRAARTALCSILVAVVVGHGAALFLEADGKATDSGGDEPYFDYMAPPVDSAPTTAL